MSNKVSLEDIVSLCKRRGFIYQGSEIYGGLSGTWDYGPLGVALKRNIMNLWWKTFVENKDNMYGIDAAILMNQNVWKASGHVDTFTDPLVKCKKCATEHRADKIENNKCPTCGSVGEFTKPEQFNMMFKTVVGPKFYSIEPKEEEYVALKSIPFKKKSDDSDGTDFPVNDPDRELSAISLHDKNSISYIRPETAQGIFTNFKNVVDSLYPDLPFGLAQMGKAFRNEISPRDFVFRSREFEQMEIEYFVDPKTWEKDFEDWRKEVHKWLDALGLPKENVHELEVAEEDRAHYSKRTIDFEFDFPHGRDELLGLAYRTDYDLSQHQEHSKKNQEYRPKGEGKPFIPHVIEPSFGVERAIMAVLTSAYTEDEVEGEKRTVLKLPVHLAPVKVAVSPLLKNKKELVDKARDVFVMLKKEFGAVMWDDNGNIGKRYRRQDEIGTPYCVTIDFDTLDDDSVTVRNRDTTKQERVKIDELAGKLKLA